MNIFKKIQTARSLLHAEVITKSGDNNGKPFFELKDFMPRAITIFTELGLCGVCSFDRENASLTVHDCDTEQTCVVTCPMGRADLPKCHDVQNVGASITYTRRYLWMTLLDIIENDGLDYQPRAEFDIGAHIFAMQEAKTTEDLATKYAEAERQAALSGDKSAMKTLHMKRSEFVKKIRASEPLTDERFAVAMASVKDKKTKIESVESYNLSDAQQRAVADYKASLQ